MDKFIAECLYNDQEPAKTSIYELKSAFKSLSLLNKQHNDTTIERKRLISQTQEFRKKLSES